MGRLNATLLSWGIVFLPLAVRAQPVVFDTDKENPGFASSILGKPSDWNGDSKDLFSANYNFPGTAPDMSNELWMQLNPQLPADRAKYYDAVLAYGLKSFQSDIKAGCTKTAANWVHAPWMTFPFGSSVDDVRFGRIRSGREPICGLTQERAAPVGYLHKQQARRVQSWAVGTFNAAGGALLGKIFKNKEDLDLSETKFANGTFVVKFLFTEATEAEVPYLTGAPTWEANIYEKEGSQVRKTQTVRLVQIDFGIRDKRMDKTGWVFGTFLYFADPNAPNADWKKNLIAVGSMWGNDPKIKDSTKYVEQALNPAVAALRDSGKLYDLASTRKGFGWYDRVNGPIDNPASACHSCHASAQVHKTKAILHFGPPSPVKDDDDQKMLWFRNVMAGDTFTFTADELKLVNQKPSKTRSKWTVGLMKDFISTDYSLQLRMAIETSRDYRLVQKAIDNISVNTPNGPSLFNENRLKELREDYKKEASRIERD